ncbi:MAG: oxidoreductase [Planctomycetes bacterium]|nr:oxidoreductase [Planctomycetota bacterium]
MRALCPLAFSFAVSCAGAPVATSLQLDWHDRPTGSAASLRGLAAVDAHTAIVSGSNGAVLRTDDGGATWRDISPPECANCDFRDVEALSKDELVLMVAGQPARVYRSVDGGANWRLAHEDPRPEAFFDALAFHGCRGVLFGDPLHGAFALLRSDDGGTSWAPTDALPPARDGEAAFAASGTCLVAAGDGAFVLATGGAGSRLIRFTVDGSRRETALPLAEGASARGAFSVAVSGEQLCVVGGDYQNPLDGAGTAAWSADGGATFHSADALGYRSAVQWLDDRTLLAVGSHGASVSDDGGATWRAFGGVGFHALAVADDGAVWACGSDGRVAQLLVAR